MKDAVAHLSSTATFPNAPLVDMFSLPCPNCGLCFKTSLGFADHMTIEHWWEWRQAEGFWRNQSSVGPEGLAG